MNSNESQSSIKAFLRRSWYNIWIFEKREVGNSDRKCNSQYPIPYPPIMEERYKMAETNEIDQSERSTLIESHPKKKKETKSNIHRVNCINIFDRVIIWKMSLLFLISFLIFRLWKVISLEREIKVNWPCFPNCEYFTTN